MKVLLTFSIFSMSLLLLNGCSSQSKNKNVVQSTESKDIKTGIITHKSIALLIEEWPEASKAGANSMITKYGLPDESTSSMLVWNDTGPFKRTIVHREEITHNFPSPHSDVIEQVVDYKVPVGKVDDLWEYDGSIILDRTKGEMRARNDKEEMNFLAFNLADKIIQGEMTVNEARIEYARSAQAFSMGNTNQFTNSLTFRPDSETADADKALSAKGLRPINGRQSQQIREAQEETIEALDQKNIE